MLILLLYDIKIINFYMINSFSIVLIIFIICFLLIFKRKHIITFLNKKTFSLPKEIDKQHKKIISSSKTKSIFAGKIIKRYSEFEKKALRIRMLKLFKGQKEDKLEALNIAANLADRSTLHILRLGLKDMEPDIVKRSAFLIRKFK